MRGPMASRVINQLVAMTEWGELDYLVSIQLYYPSHCPNYLLIDCRYASGNINNVILITI